MPAGQGNPANLDTSNDWEEHDTTEECPRCKVEDEPVLKEGEGWASWECPSCCYVFDTWHAEEEVEYHETTTRTMKHLIWCLRHQPSDSLLELNDHVNMGSENDCRIVAVGMGFDWVMSRYTADEALRMPVIKVSVEHPVTSSRISEAANV